MVFQGNHQVRWAVYEKPSPNINDVPRLSFCFVPENGREGVRIPTLEAAESSSQLALEATHSATAWVCASTLTCSMPKPLAAAQMDGEPGKRFQSVTRYCGSALPQANSR